MNQPPSFTLTKQIYTENDVSLFQKSLASKNLHQVMAFLVHKVKAVEVPRGYLSSRVVTRDSAETHPEDIQNDGIELSSQFQIVVDVLNRFEELLNETPPLEGPRRFGNMACRDWHKKIGLESFELLKKFGASEEVTNELNQYLLGSFGSDVRLDYGSGHELSFVAFVGGLLECKLIDRNVHGQELLALFGRYYDLTRRLITEYNLEPAGSHGVWGLDDHFHFIYILGAAQFNIGKEDQLRVLVPAVQQVLSSMTLNTYKTSNFYVNAIAFIFKLKLGPFFEHSPILYDIHKSVSLWAKVESGLLKMYEVEVFRKFPVVQHFWFGRVLYPWKDAETLRDMPTNSAIPKVLDHNEKQDVLPGMPYGIQGMKTTKNNISLTGAPWAVQSNSSKLHGRMNLPAPRNARS